MSYMCLQRKHLLADVMDGFQEGLFFSKLSEGKFNSVWIVYVLEANEEKAFKGTGGIIKLALKVSCQTCRAKYSMQFHESVGKSQIKSGKMGTYHPSDSKAADRSS